MQKIDSLAHLLNRAYLHASQHSQDKKTKTGALVFDENYDVLTIGANRFPDGLVIDDLVEKNKYPFIIHAEVSNILDAAKRGIRLDGKTMLSYWLTCCPCATHVVGAGIKELIIHKEFQELSDSFEHNYTEDFERAKKTLHEGGVKLTSFSMPYAIDTVVRFKGTDYIYDKDNRKFLPI